MEAHLLLTGTDSDALKQLIENFVNTTHFKRPVDVSEVAVVTDPDSGKSVFRLKVVEKTVP